jgi:hypothetical protein
MTWIAKASPKGAQRWLDQFEKATSTLETNPFVAPLAPESKSFDIGIRHILLTRGTAGRIGRSSRWWTTRFATSGFEDRVAPDPARGHPQRVTYADITEGMIGILFTQRMMDSPEPPKVFVDFWTLAFGAME